MAELAIKLLIFFWGIAFSKAENYSVQLDENTFSNAIQKNNHFVMFYAPWCGHCKSLRPVFEELAELMNVKDGNVVIAKVDCTQEKALCSQHSITAYPTLLFFKLNKKDAVRFRGTRDMPTITDFIHEQFMETNEIESGESKLQEETKNAVLVELTEENFAKVISSGNHFVKFYVPWCSHCQLLASTWEKLAKSLQHQTALQISKIDCTVHRSSCQDFDVKGYPTLLWIEDGKKIEKYSGSRDHDELKAYAEKMIGVKKTSTDAKDLKTKDESDKVLELNADTFQTNIKSGITFIKFYAPWCGHCQHLAPIWKQLAEKVYNNKSKVKIAKVDCTTTENKNLCLDQQIEGYPTLFAYKDGNKLSEYNGGRSIQDLINYIHNMIGHEEL